MTTIFAHMDMRRQMHVRIGLESWYGFLAYCIRLSFGKYLKGIKYPTSRNAVRAHSAVVGYQWENACSSPLSDNRILRCFSEDLIAGRSLPAVGVAPAPISNTTTLHPQPTQTTPA